MSEHPLVSVILPVHNRAGLVVPAIRSVLDQSYRELELIVVDDGSDDGTAEVLGRMRSSRMLVLRQPHRGAAAARNRGVEASRGQLIAFQDSDDLWLPHRLEQQVATMLAAPPEVGVVYGGFIRVCSDQKRRYFPPRSVRWAHRLRLPGRRLDGDLSRSLLRGNLITTQAALVRRSCIEAAGGFDPELERFDDWDLWLSIAGKWRFEHIDAPLAEVRITPGSLSSDSAAAVRDLERMAGKHPTGRRPLLAVASFIEGEHCIVTGQQRAGLAHLGRAVRLAPGNAWYWLALISALAGSRGLARASSITGLGYHRKKL